MYVGHCEAFGEPMKTRSTTGRVVNTATQDWVPLGDGQSFKPIAFGPLASRQLLLRVESGAVVALHRHHGAVHAFTVSGRRVLLDPAGNIDIEAGSYVYEPPGNVVSSSGTPELRATYLAWCAEHDLPPDSALDVS